MRKKPYLIDGVIGNGSMLLTLTKDGELQRLNWPRIDYIDQINHQWAGIWEEGQQKTAFFHDTLYSHEQWYQEDNNILVTKHTGNGWEITQTDYVLPDRDLWVRDFEMTNVKAEARKAAFVYFSETALAGQRNFQTTKFDMKNDSLLHYYRETAMAITPAEAVQTYQAGKAKVQAETNQLEGRQILNNAEGALSINLGGLQPGETKRATIYVSMAETEEQALLQSLEAKQAGEVQLRQQTETYWSDVLSERKKLAITDSKVNAIYKRSILTFHLLQNKTTGAFIAGPEVDEDYDYSGGYAYCWGRDAAFIASAVDAAGYHDSVSKFYRFMASIQSEDGSWDQRHYTDGVLAPTWGLQIDETGSILWGMNEHYQITKDENFLQEMWPAVQKGANFLAEFIDPETNLPLPSKDLWEKRDGEHLYSTAAVYGGLIGAALFAESAQQQQLADDYRSRAEKMKAAVNTLGWNETEGRYVRSLKLTVPKEQYTEAKQHGKQVLHQQNAKGVSTYMLWEDLTPDISLLGLHYPFQMIGAADEKLLQTARKIEETCTSKKIGGIERFPGDVYIGGNPWIISTLWLAIYKLKNEQEEQAMELFDWATAHASHLHLLPEQIDKETNEPAWVMPLTWSHAMYVLAIKELTAANHS